MYREEEAGKPIMIFGGINVAAVCSCLLASSAVQSQIVGVQCGSKQFSIFKKPQ
jgi:hypothetical protein